MQQYHEQDYDNPALIRLRQVVKVYRTLAGELTALRNISADFYQGEFVGIVGKSGAGKSTLVNVITGVDDVTAGDILVNNVHVQQLDESERALWRGLNVGIVYQSFELLPQLSLLDNVLLPMDFCGLYRGSESTERAQWLLEQVGLGAHIQKPPTRISGGQQQRVAIARALANDPPIIVADEPTGNLDSATARDILDMFERLIEQGKTIIMVTHDQSLESRFSRVLKISDGMLNEVTSLHPALESV